VELARVRLAEWVEAAGGAAGTGAGAGRPASPTLRPDQAATVLAPLLAVSAELPPQREAYYLLSEVARLSQGEPGPEIRAGLREGVRLFPDTRGLALAAAVWEYRAGDRSAALRMVELGLAAAPIGPDRDRLLALRRRLDGGVATPGTSAAPVDPWSAGWMTTAAIAGLDPRDRRDLGLSPDGRHLAYLAPFGGRIEQLIIVDLDRPTAPVSVRLPRAPHAEAGPLSGSRGRQGGLAATGASSGLGGSGGFGASGGSARSAGSAGLARSADWSGDRAVSAPAGSIPVAAPRLAWTPAGRIAVALGARAVFAIEATGSGLRWLRPKDPEFASVALPASVAAPSPAASAPVLDRRSQNLVGRRVPTAASRTYWSDPQLAAVQAELESKLPDRRISLLDWDQARSRFLALAQTQDGNGRCFVFRPADQLLLEVPLEGPTG
jgi:hypothetical protein